MRSMKDYALARLLVAAFFVLTAAGCASRDNTAATSFTPPPPPPAALSADQMVMLGAGKYYSGDGSAPVTMIEFADYECPFCAQDAPIVDQLLEQYKGRLKVVFRDFPVGHPHSLVLAEAARCAGEQDAFWKMHDYLFRNIEKLDTTNMGKYASLLGMDGPALESCINSRRYENLIGADAALAQQSGARGTPTFFINGKMLDGLQTYNDLAQAVDNALAAGQQAQTPKQ
jgi:protein-disulfide isomerase